MNRRPALSICFYAIPNGKPLRTFPGIALVVESLLDLTVLIGEHLADGVADTADLLTEALEASPLPPPRPGEPRERLPQFVAELREALADPAEPRRRVLLANVAAGLRQRRPNGEPLSPTDAEIARMTAALADNIESLLADGTDGVDPALAARLNALAARAEAAVEEMDFGFLYDRKRELFAIGYRLADADGPGRLDTGMYDLLASEARLASFVAIAKEDVPQDHWFKLGRPLTSVDGAPTLLSWSGTMFEYVMPRLVMRSYPGTLLNRTCALAVKRQIQYAASRGVPWGISESAFAVVDRQGHYQYKAFGVPGLGLKRGLADELVIAPYASALAVLVEPGLAARNLRRLAGLGMLARYGFFEALDFTPRTNEAMLEPLPPIVKLGRTTQGRPISRTTARASSRLHTVRPRHTSSPMRPIASANFLRSSALSMTSGFAPIIST